MGIDHDGVEPSEPEGSRVGTERRGSKAALVWSWACNERLGTRGRRWLRQDAGGVQKALGAWRGRSLVGFVTAARPKRESPSGLAVLRGTGGIVAAFLGRPGFSGTPAGGGFVRLDAVRVSKTRNQRRSASSPFAVRHAPMTRLFGSRFHRLLWKQAVVREGAEVRDCNGFYLFFERWCSVFAIAVSRPADARCAPCFVA